MARLRWIGALLLGLAPFPAHAADCAMSEPDRAWLQQALAQWQATETGVLHLPANPLPQIIAVDGACTYSLPAGDFAVLTATPHGDTVTFPDGGEAPVGPISFASGEAGYFAMSLPSVWRAAGVESDFGLERLMTGVLLHEMMHIRQTELAKAALAGVPQTLGIPDDELTDDIVQERFSADPEYVAAYEAERYKFYAAAEAETDEDARRLAGEGLALLRERRARFFTGKNAGFTQLDDVFLTMEGMGQLLIYRYFRGFEEHGPAVEGVRRGGKWWSQDEGLAIMLVVDRLLPDWQARAFREPDWRAENLLAAAVAAQ